VSPIKDRVPLFRLNSSGLHDIKKIYNKVKNGGEIHATDMARICFE
jgi:hypothetical protein